MKFVRKTFRVLCGIVKRSVHIKYLQNLYRGLTAEQSSANGEEPLTLSTLLDIFENSNNPSWHHVAKAR